MNSTYRICNRCVMDTTDPDIHFDENGHCNHCRSLLKAIETIKHNHKYSQENLKTIVSKIRNHGKNKEYDSILGISGGVDSSFLAYNVKKLGLRPLVVHFDNGWDSELAVNNIENIVKKLDFDLYTYVIDWEEFKDLQRSFFKASVVDIEMLTDHAIMATMFKLARKYKIKYVLSGTNIATEFIMPSKWLYQKWDIKNIKSIQKRYGTKKIDKFPIYGPWAYFFTRYLYKFEYVEILNYIDYNKNEAIEILKNELGWKYYGGKHYESVFTRFYQGYILPRKYGIDKRRAHLSNLVCTGQITRDDALKDLTKETYEPDLIRQDKEYVIKKLCYTNEEFEQILQDKPKTHLEYPNSYWIYRLYKKLTDNRNKT